MASPSFDPNDYIEAAKARAPDNERANDNGQSDEPRPLTVIDGGANHGRIPPREWLLGAVFCRRYVSALIAQGASGKTALRHAEYLSLASGKSLLGHYVHKRARVLIITFEDGLVELRRRIQAAKDHHGLTEEDLSGWLFLCGLQASDGKLMIMDERGRPVRGELYRSVYDTIEAHSIDLVSFDPFAKVHDLDENANSQLDTLMQDLSNLADEKNVAIDIIHHAKKGSTSPGDSDLGRGASAIRDACRFVETLSQMTSEEAQEFGIEERERRLYARVDAAKMNLAPPAGQAEWYRLVGVNLGNGNEENPNGDNVQTIEPWEPPKAWDGLSVDLCNRILDDIAAGTNDGQRYSDANSANTRAAWKIVQSHVPDKPKQQCKNIIKTWVKNGVLHQGDYWDQKERRTRSGLYVDNQKRPH